MRIFLLMPALALAGCDFDGSAKRKPEMPHQPWFMERDVTNGGVWRLNRETGQLSNCWRHFDMGTNTVDVQCSDAPNPSG